MAFTWNGCKLLVGGGMNPNIDQILAAGFNTCGPMMTFDSAFLDECLRKGLWVVADLLKFYITGKDLAGAVNFVNQWKGHPAIGAWFLADEPENRGWSAAEQQTWYDALKAADPTRDFLSNFTKDPRAHYNPNAFDHCSLDIYPFQKSLLDPWGTWQRVMDSYCKTWNNTTGGIGGMAWLQAFHDIPQGILSPAGYILNMLRKFQEHGIGTQKDGYGGYIWTDGHKGTSRGISEDPGILNDVKTVHASYDWPHDPPEPKEAITMLGDYSWTGVRDGTTGRTIIPLLIQRLKEMGATDYMHQVWKYGHQWTDFKLLAPECQKAGIRLWLYNVPPSEPPPPEPFHYDWVRWAEEVARLMLQYPVIQGMLMDDFNGNYNHFTIPKCQQFINAARAIAPNFKFIPVAYMGHGSIYGLESHMEAGVFDAMLLVYWWPWKDPTKTDGLRPQIEEYRSWIDSHSPNRKISFIPFIISWRGGGRVEPLPGYVQTCLGICMTAYKEGLIEGMATYCLPKDDPQFIQAVATVYKGEPPTYPCPHCPATFGSQAELDAHIASEHPSPTYPCPHCPATFGSQAELDAHIASVHPSPTYPCPYCPAILGSKAELDAHIASVHPSPPPQWLRPSRHHEATGHWRLVERIYDGDIGTYGYCPKDLIADSSWAKALELITPAITSSKVRIYADGCQDPYYRMNIKVLKNGSWEQIFQGHLARNTWVEKSFAPGSVTRARINIFRPAGLDMRARIKEFQFGFEGEGFTSEDITCPTCESRLRITRSSILENNRGLNCSICGKYLGPGTKVEVIHAEPWPPPTYPCPYCPAAFSTQAELDGHIASEHPEETFTTKEVTCTLCNSILRVTISSIAENNKTLTCPLCQTTLSQAGTKVEIVSTPVIDQLRADIRALDEQTGQTETKVAELKGKIAEARAKVDAIKKLLGM